ncbi:Granaticin polyketide synthase ketoacyl reductase 2 [Hyphodiscus hymeniophilus]|uniref:Granaticin polyketide synthase ketoacyl reductase 2 n=1 Tax=Hyphodiscus hymeniophilus TaxID=353542 RepID=A0A9P6SLW4_9HELO|nr:Granaticin polyketide synthase ketoacyl reductase 2 [Hyphodiscus hymeniophilus]
MQARGLGELICLKFAEAGCSVAINYNASADRAKSVAVKIEKEYGVKAVVIRGGYTRFSDFSDLSSATVSDWDKCFAVNVKAQTHLMQAAIPIFNNKATNPEGGVFIITSSIAGKTVGGSSMPYSVTKAAQLHLMRCLAKTQGPTVRVNAVLPGWLDTEWGAGYSKEAIKDLCEKASLKKATDLEDCAISFLDIARNSSMTGREIQVDSGLGVN